MATTPSLARLSLVSEVSDIADPTLQGLQAGRGLSLIHLLMEWDEHTFIHLIPRQFVWKQTDAGPGQHQTMDNLRRISLIYHLAKFLGGHPNTLKGPRNARDPWEWMADERRFGIVYFELADGSGAAPEWRDREGRLLVDEEYHGNDIDRWGPQNPLSFPMGLEWLTWEWEQLDDDDKAILLSTIVYHLLPSEAWLGLEGDMLPYLPEEEDDFAIFGRYDFALRNETYEDAVMRALPRNSNATTLWRDARHGELSRGVHDIDARETLREWVDKAFERVPRSVWLNQRVSDFVLDQMPTLLGGASVEVTRFDRLFVERLREVLSRGAHPDGAEHQRDRERHRAMMREAGIRSHDMGLRKRNR